MCSIVVADDEFLERDVIKDIARGIQGARIVGEGNSGRHAVELCGAMKPDLIFINCGMGGMDGFEAIKRIRKSDRDVAIVLTSAYDKHATRRNLDGLDINEFLLKPVRPDKIREVINKYVKKNRNAENGSAITPRSKKRLRFYPNQIMSKEITRALIYIDDNYKGGISLESTAEIVALSSYYFSRLFKKEVGLNFSEFLLHKRLSLAKQLLEETDSSVLDIAISVGYHEQSYFCKVFKKTVGMTPRDYRKQACSAKKDRLRVVSKYI